MPLDLIKLKEIKSRPKNLLIEDPTALEDNSDVDFEELHSLFNLLQKKYSRTKILHDKEKKKTLKLKTELSSVYTEIESLKKQVASLKEEIEEASVVALQKPKLQRETTSTTPKEEIIITDNNNLLVVKSNTRGIIQKVGYISKRDRNKKLDSLRKLYLDTH